MGADAVNIGCVGSRHSGCSAFAVCVCEERFRNFGRECVRRRTDSSSKEDGDTGEAATRERGYEFKVDGTGCKPELAQASSGLHPVRSGRWKEMEMEVVERKRRSWWR